MPAAVVVVIFGITAIGFFLYRSEDKKAKETAAAARVLPANWLQKYFGTENEYDERVGGPDADPDNDILTNLQEFYFNTDPTNPDTDNDGQLDGAEVAVNSNPTGEGEIFSTSYARSVADTFIEEHGLYELKEENIQKQVLGILNPQDPEEVEIPFPDPATLKISNDVSIEAIGKYFQEIDAAGIELTQGIEQLQYILENPHSSDAAITLGRAHETIEKLRNIAVPTPFMHFHQLHVAALIAASKILETQQIIDQSADPETQKDKLSQQYYQVQVIEKIDQFLLAEIERLQEKYKPIIEKYSQEAEQ